MTLRRRLAVAAAAAVGIAVLLAVGVAYMVVRRELRNQVDAALKAQASAVRSVGFHALGDSVPGIPASAGGPAQYVQIVVSGNVYVRRGGLNLPVDARVRAVGRSGSSTLLTDVFVGHNHLREVVFSVPVEVNGQPSFAAVQLARPLNSIDSVLRKLRAILGLLLLGGVGIAALLGRLAARRVLVPLAEVARTVDRIGTTDDLSTRLQPRTDDEVGQLARRFNEMLARLEQSRGALDESVRAQRQLIADASHELRTPVTSLRTNIEILLLDAALSPEERERLLSDVVEQSEELSALVGDLIEVARGDLPDLTSEEVRLDHVVEESVARARRNTPGLAIEAHLAPVVLEGVPERLGRAVNNLLDNAARYGAAEQGIEVTVDGEGVRVRDHGPGIPQDDLGLIFDRFYRGATARGRQGSGLGLSIVRQVAEQHGGTAVVRNAPGGGAEFCLRLPCSPVAEDSGDGVAEGSGDGVAEDSGDEVAEGPGARSAMGQGGAGDAGLARGQEALAQEPEAEGEGGAGRQQDEQPALAPVPGGAGEGELHRDRGEGGEQQGV